MSNDSHVSKLHPAIRDKVVAFLQAAGKKGINLKITDSVRTMQQQADLYAKGRTAPGSIVTNAKPGESYHNYALAVDVVEMRNGVAVWEEGARWAEIGQLGKACGLRWGGDFKSIVDRPHFEFGPGLAALSSKYNAGSLKDGFVVV